MSGRNSAVTAFLAFGGNLGEPRKAMAAALRRLDAHAAIEVVAVSPLYRTPPWGKTDQPDYFNAVAEIRTSIGPRDLLTEALNTETALDRVRGERWGPRTIDIDILTYGDERRDEPGLTIPHPRMLERAFVMVPLAFVAPRLVLDGRTAADRADALDRSGMERLTEDGRWW